MIGEQLLRDESTITPTPRDAGPAWPAGVVLTLAACATLVVGGDSMTAIWQWAERASQDKLARLGARRNPLTGRFLGARRTNLPARAGQAGCRRVWMLRLVAGSPTSPAAPHQPRW